MLPKDLIIEIDNEEVINAPRLQEITGRHRPGDKVPLTALRNGKERKIVATLKNIEGTTSVVKKS